jgi:hypothetical protein
MRYLVRILSFVFYVLSSLCAFIFHFVCFFCRQIPLLSHAHLTHNYYRKENGAIISSSRLPPSRAPFLRVLSFASAFRSSFLLSYIKGTGKSRAQFWGNSIRFCSPTDLRGISPLSSNTHHTGEVYDSYGPENHPSRVILTRGVV